ncbi:MAG: hypothetical protein CENE_01001 [Candidatus Celerinatantimonas neptuna]|nr:MAG: hypothetical protein CENE_01001 [Candidatus Celerinatantimonas neptuna]
MLTRKPVSIITVIHPEYHDFESDFVSRMGNLHFYTKLPNSNEAEGSGQTQKG